MNNSFDARRDPFVPPGAKPSTERRRHPRWKVHVPVFVYGHAASQEPFHEEAYSVVISDSGALLIMTTLVPTGEKLLLTNKVTELEQECRVVNAGRQDGASVEIAVEFTSEAKDFWRITAGPRPASTVSTPDAITNAR
jgi:hypothetical protein